MWTHRAPYAPSELSVESIERHGRMALYRALHYERLVVFVGSGVSAAYGGPPWSKLAETMVGEVQKAFERAASVMYWRLTGDIEPSKTNARWPKYFINFIPMELRSFHQNLRDILGCPDGPLRFTAEASDTLGGQIATALALLEDALRRAEAVFPTKVWEAFGNAEKSKNDGLDRFTNSLTAASRKRLVFEIARSSADSEKTPRDVDVVAGLRALGLKRFATLNYDLLLEKRLRTLRDGDQAGDEIRSEELTPSDTSPLLNFAVADGDAASRVIHIHGSVDNPANTVVTEDDYRRLYVATDDADGSLNEATRILFAGNDILFVGVGLKEDDVMGPLRGVLVRDSSPDADARQTLALMPPSAAPLSLNSHLSPRNHAKQNEDAQQKQARQDAMFAIHQKIKYGVNVLRFGGRDPLFLDCLRFIKALKLEAGKRSTSKRDTKISHAIKLRIKNRIRSASPNNEKKEILSDNDFKEISDIIKKINANNCGPESDALNQCKIIEGRILARGLVDELASIKKWKGEWWDDWHRLPRERWARLHVRTTAPYPVWVRHCPTQVTTVRDLSSSAFDASSEKKTPFGAAKLMACNLKGGESPAYSRRRTRILRLAVPRGGGKGAFIRQLFEPEAHQDLFKHKTYEGAFFAHMSFSIEFSSVVSALSRFVAGRIASLRASIYRENADCPYAAITDFYENRIEVWEKAPEDAIEDGLPSGPRRLNRLEVLRALLRRYSDLTRDRESRLFICLGGLERLCNANGDAHNPMHRAFFRLLTGSGDTTPGGGPGDPPIDLVLVVSRGDTPIAYLSREAPAEIPPAERRNYVRRSGTGRSLRKWDALPRHGWEERAKLTPHWAKEQLKPDQERTVDPAQAAMCTLLSKEKPNGPTGPFTSARRQFWDSIGLCVWGLSNFSEYAKFERNKQNLPKPPDEAAETRLLLELAESWLLRMSRSAAKGQFGGVLSEIFAVYDEIDSSDPELRTRLRVVLEHLALFVLPVERMVLYHCPEIRARLDDAGGPSEKPRTGRFKKLGDALDLLVARGLVMEVMPGGEAGRARIEAERDLHMRYVLHDQLREYIAEGVGLFVPDGGDRNHFEVTLYSEQARDTPTPSWERFQRVRDIIDLQIGASRDTLEAFYVLQKYAAKPIEDRHLKPIEAALETIKEVCFDADQDLGLCGHFGRLHAVPQRLRACYALLRGAFSIGALSRLASDHIGPDDDRPFDLYRDWLRSLVNAGVGVHETKPVVKRALAGEVIEIHLDPTRTFQEGEQALGRLHGRLEEYKKRSNSKEKNNMRKKY